MIAKKKKQEHDRFFRYAEIYRAHDEAVAPVGGATAGAVKGAQTKRGKYGDATMRPGKLKKLRKRGKKKELENA